MNTYKKIKYQNINCKSNKKKKKKRKKIKKLKRNQARKKKLILIRILRMKQRMVL